MPPLNHALRERNGPDGIGGIMHCFTGTAEHALRCLQMGFTLSFSGIVTFPRSADLRATASQVPSDRLLVETDAPYLTPAPYRKIRRNEPRFVVETARTLASVRDTTLEEVARQTAENFHALVGGTAVEPGISAT